MTVLKLEEIEDDLIQINVDMKLFFYNVYDELKQLTEKIKSLNNKIKSNTINEDESGVSSSSARIIDHSFEDNNFIHYTIKIEQEK